MPDSSVELILVMDNELKKIDSVYSMLDSKQQAKHIQNLCWEFLKSNYNIAWRDLRSCVKAYLTMKENEYENHLNQMALESEWDSYIRRC